MRRFQALLPLSVLVCMVGCVRVYQPMSGMVRPVVVDPSAPNLVGLRLGIDCVPGDALNQGGANRLCRPLQRLFENQGATVSVVKRGVGAGQEPPEPTDLVLRIESEEVFSGTRNVSFAASIATFTLAPAITEMGFSQRITIKDGTGFFLVEDRLQGRMVERAGAGPWLAHGVANWTRKKEDRVNSKAADEDLSRDMYAQLSQLVYNAKIHWEIQQRAKGQAPPTAEVQAKSLPGLAVPPDSEPTVNEPSATTPGQPAPTVAPEQEPSIDGVEGGE